MKYFEHKYETKKSIADVRREMLSTLTPALAANSYTLTTQSDIGVTYSRSYRRWYIIALAICLFPIGLLFLLATDEATITVTVDEDDATEHCTLNVNGRAPKNVREGFEEMEV